MTSKDRFIKQLVEVWGITPTSAEDIYDMLSWDDLGTFIANEGERLPISELVAIVTLFADIMKSPRSETKSVDNIMDEL